MHQVDIHHLCHKLTLQACLLSGKEFKVVRVKTYEDMLQHRVMQSFLRKQPKQGNFWTHERFASKITEKMLVHTIHGIAICLIGSDFPATCTKVMKACCIHALSSKICSNSFQWRQTKLADGDVYLPKKPGTKITNLPKHNTAACNALALSFSTNSKFFCFQPAISALCSSWEADVFSFLDNSQQISSGASSFGLRFDKRQKVCQIYLISLFHSLLYNSNIHLHYILH